MTAKHMETQREAAPSRTFHLISEWPKIALSVLNTGSQSASVGKKNASRPLPSSIGSRRSNFLATPSKTSTKLVFTPLLNQTHKHGSSERTLLGRRQFLVSLPPNAHHLFYFRGNLVRAQPPGAGTEGGTEHVLLCVAALTCEGERGSTSEKQPSRFPGYLRAALRQPARSDPRPRFSWPLR